MTVVAPRAQARSATALRSAHAPTWAAQSDISARSTLVTILGDTVAPLNGAVWTSDLISLAEPFGFSPRLVRTSLFRLASEGWVANERIGRRSRYNLTNHGRRETEAAERRIYRLPRRSWDGSWTLVFLPPQVDEASTQPLRWRGFARMTDLVLARPGDHTTEARELLDHLEVEPVPPVAAARFDDGAPVAGKAFRHDSGLAEAEEAYHRFLGRYGWAGDIDTNDLGSPADRPIPTDHNIPTGHDGPNGSELLADLAPSEAFALRTMVVHDLRRARLRDPDLPTDLLPTGWIGHRAMALAATVYRAVTGPAWHWVADITGLATDPTSPPLPDRFPKETP